MIEVLKQAAEDVSKAYDVLAFAHTERALELLAKTRTSLRQAIREHAMYEVQRLGQEIEQEPVTHQKWCASLTQLLMSMPPQPAPCNCQPPQRKCENCGEFGTCCLKTESQERNFCPRCGKRTNYIHTCTPPRDTHD